LFLQKLGSQERLPRRLDIHEVGSKTVCQLFDARLLACKVQLLCKVASLCVLISSYKLSLNPSPELKLVTRSTTNLESRPKVIRIMGLYLLHPDYISTLILASTPDFILLNRLNFQATLKR
jgi:hypothetical protein